MHDALVKGTGLSRSAEAFLIERGRDVLGALAGFTQLVMLDLSKTQVTDTGLKEMAGLQQLRLRLPVLSL